jgi:membrane-bound lytic murein transglycosylase D
MSSIFCLFFSSFISLSLFEYSVHAAVPKQEIVTIGDSKNTGAKKSSSVKKEANKEIKLLSKGSVKGALIFDLPVTYNEKVSRWVAYFQHRGQKWFREWLERASIYMPMIQNELRKANLPTDLAYMVMIESGFSPNAVSHASAVGPWQFIEPTGKRYGLRATYWLDERRDLKKSTLAAIRYLKDLHAEFGSWYLVAASYNMGENGLRRQIRKHGTTDYWTLIRRNALPQETQDYVPKILAAMLIAKAPSLYGFRSLERLNPLEYDVINVPGGTDLDELAEHLGVTRKSIKDLNAELVLGYIPRGVTSHYIRIPRGSARTVSQYIHGKKSYSFD